MGNYTSATTSTDNASDVRLYTEIRPEQWPIIYSPEYDISFAGLERLHPFDSCKWSKVYRFLLESGMVTKETITEPLEVTREELLEVHTPQYLDSLNSSSTVAAVVEIPPAAIIPNVLLRNRVLRPFRFHTGGTVLAGKLAKERGWAINIGGGFHHSYGEQGGGFCVYADITLSVKLMLEKLGISKVMIVDLDAHQGNGHERDFWNDERVYIMDMYNKWIYPGDHQAKAAIKKKIELDINTQDEEYLECLRSELPAALEEFIPDMIVYNAGTDILVGDALGRLNVTPEGVIERDEIVFREAKRRNIPIFMVTSGGYQRTNARVIADSILNLRAKKLISAPNEDPHIVEQLRVEGITLEDQGVGGVNEE